MNEVKFVYKYCVKLLLFFFKFKHNKINKFNHLISILIAEKLYGSGFSCFEVS